MVYLISTFSLRPISHLTTICKLTKLKLNLFQISKSIYWIYVTYLHRQWSMILEFACKNQYWGIWFSLWKSCSPPLSSPHPIRWLHRLDPLAAVVVVVSVADWNCWHRFPCVGDDDGGNFLRRLNFRLQLNKFINIDININININITNQTIIKYSNYSQ